MIDCIGSVKKLKHSKYSLLVARKYNTLKVAPQTQNAVMSELEKGAIKIQSDDLYEPDLQCLYRHKNDLQYKQALKSLVGLPFV